MVLTNDDVKKDIVTITERLGDGAHTIANPLTALNLSSIYTLPCTVLHAAITIFIYATISNSSVVLWGFLIIASFSFVVTLTQYTNALMYLAIPESVRRESIILSRIKKVYLRTVLMSITANILTVLLFFFTREYLLAIPIVFIAGFLLNQVVLNTEITRYGIGALLHKTATLIKRI